MKISSFLMVAMIGVSTFGVGAHAGTQPAMAGHGWPNPIDPCFFSSFAQVMNTCTDGPHLLIVPMQVSAGGYQASARASGRGYNDSTTCQAMAIGPSNNGWSFTGIGSTSVSADAQTITLGSIGVPAHGTAHFECRLALSANGVGGRVINVELN